MKIRVIMLTGCLLISLLAACGEEPDLSDNSLPDTPSLDNYPDPLACVLKEALNKSPEEPITKTELATLTHLQISLVLWEIPITAKRLTDLAHCVNLTELDLTVEGWVDLKPLAKLHKLRKLTFEGKMLREIIGPYDLNPLRGLINLTHLDLSVPQNTDLSPLAGLITLKELNLSENEIFDIQPLAGLVNLQRLELQNNLIMDIQPLAGLVNLQHLKLTRNYIGDITPLSRLTHLEKLYFDDNTISNLKPLVDNPGLVNENPIHFEGKIDPLADLVDVEANPLSDISRNVHIPALEARGVIVRH